MKRVTIGKPPLMKVFLTELIISLVVGLVLLPLSVEVAYSAWIGGAIAAASNLAFSLPAYRYQGAAEVHKMVRNFFQGEMAKILVAALLFAAVFKWVQPVNLIALFTVFALLLTLHGVVPGLLDGKRQNR